jgi:hypothetical protein
MSLVPRPDRGGTLGKTISLQTNMIPITSLSKVSAFQYDIAMNPEVGSDVSRRVFQQCETLIQKLHPNTWYIIA